MTKTNLQERILDYLKDFQDGVAFKRLGMEVLGSASASGLLHWRGASQPLVLHLTVGQIQKLGLNVEGLEVYEKKSLGRKRIPIYLHPQFRQRWSMLKPMEKLSMSQTPTLKGLEAERQIRELVHVSKKNAEKSLKQEVGSLYVVIKCPKCGHEVHLKAE